MLSSQLRSISVRHLAPDIAGHELMTHHIHGLKCACNHVDRILTIEGRHEGTSRFLSYESEDLATQGIGVGWQAAS